jgi:hypothetical protein
MQAYIVIVYTVLYCCTGTIGATQPLGEQEGRVASDTRDDTAVMSSKAAANTNDTGGSSTTAGAEAAKAAVATPTVAAAAAPTIAAAAPPVAATAPVQQHVSDLSTMRSALAASKSSRVRVIQCTYLYSVVILHCSVVLAVCLRLQCTIWLYTQQHSL